MKKRIRMIILLVLLLGTSGIIFAEIFIVPFLDLKQQKESSSFSPDFLSKSHDQIAEEFTGHLLKKEYEKGYQYLDRVIKEKFSYTQYVINLKMLITTYGSFQSIKMADKTGIKERIDESAEYRDFILYIFQIETKNYFLDLKISMEKQSKKIWGFFISNIRSKK